LTALLLARSLIAKTISLFESKAPRVMTARTNPPQPAAMGNRLADQVFATAGAHLRFRDEGHGAAVLMIHGWTLDLEMWEPQVRALRDAFRVVRLDRRGFGLSTGRPSVRQDVADIGLLCAYLEIRRVAIVGMSQGVRAALGFALRAPEMISALVLDGPPDFRGPDSAADDGVPLDRYRALIRTHGITAFRREWNTHPLVSLRTGDPRMREILTSMIQRYPGNDLMECAVDDGAVASSAPIDSIVAPALVITGDHEPATRTQAADALARRLPGAARAVIQHAGHLPNLDNPNDYNAAVRAFLEHHATSLR
jgi:3-oxoadipate enol-lactonase